MAEGEKQRKHCKLQIERKSLNYKHAYFPKNLIIQNVSISVQYVFYRLRASN